MTLEEREITAQWYEEVARRTLGTEAALATRYNLEGARFLRGHVKRIAASAPDYAAEIEHLRVSDQDDEQ